MIRSRNYQQAAKILKQLGEAGDAEAQYRLAALYRTGRGVDRSVEQATRWFERAARQGHANAQYSLALLHLRDRDNDSGLRDAQRWLSAAARQGHAAAGRKLQNLATQAPQDAEQTDNRASETDPVQLEQAMRRAAAIGDREQVERLLMQGVDVDAVDRYGRNALIEAVSQRRLGVVRTLLAHDARIELSDRFSDNALLIAAGNGSIKILTLLIASGARLDPRDRNGNTPLLLAAARGHRNIVELLIRKGADPLARNRQGDSALDLAPGTNKALTRLLSRFLQTPKPSEADNTAARAARLQNRDGSDQGIYSQWPPLLLAAWRQQHDLIKTLIAQGAAVDIVDAEGHSPLSRAVTRGDLDSVKLLLEAGADPNLEGVQPPALIRALAEPSERRLQIASALLATGATPSVVDPAGVPALILAVEAGDVGLVGRFLSAGAELELADREGVTPLMHASHNGDVAMVDLLLDSGASIDTLDIRGRQALEHAVDGTSPEVMQQLFAAGARPSVGADGSNLFHRVARSGSGVLIPILLNHEVKPDTPDLRGNTPLIVAAALGHSHVLEVLLALGADIGHRNSDGNTALHLAVANSRSKTTETLLGKGADPGIRNLNGENALTLARALDDAALIQLIETRGKKSWLGLF